MENALSRYGIKTVPSAISHDVAGCAAAAKKIGYPIALKIISPQMPHKTDAGAVATGIKNGAELAAQFGRLSQIAAKQRAAVDGYLVQKMAQGGIELIIGGKRDPQFGQLILLGLGGIYVEVFKDVTFRVCPISVEDGFEMMRDLSSYKMLAGARGKRGINEQALAELLAKVSRYLMKENPAELDLNPVIASERGCEIVDVRIIG